MTILSSFFFLFILRHNELTNAFLHILEVKKARLTGIHVINHVIEAILWLLHNALTFASFECIASTCIYMPI